VTRTTTTSYVADGRTDTVARSVTGVTAPDDPSTDTTPCVTRTYGFDGDVDWAW
jgi:hypothetical protein